MTSQKSRQERMWKQVIDAVDGYLIPISFGLLSMVILVQLFSTIPTIRAKLDTMEGRFSAVPAEVIPSSVNQEQTQISLHLSPNQTDPGVQVFNNSKFVGTFTSPELTLTVREGDRISLQTQQTGTVYITVDHNDPNLLLPAPGQTIELSPQQQTASFPAVQFTH